jgi:hypothetical protein
MRVYQLIPQDVLCFGTAPQTVAGAELEQASVWWPAPCVIFDAFHGALHRAFPQVQLWEHPHAFGKNGRYPSQAEKSQRFGSLLTAGPFPGRRKGKELQWFFPCPSDAVVAADTTIASLLPIGNAKGHHNLPKPLRCPLGNPFSERHSRPAPWWSKTAVEAYLKNSSPHPAELWDSDELFGCEWQTSRAISPKAPRQQGESTYSFQALRLRENVALGIAASMLLKERNYTEGMDELYRDRRRSLVLGGQQRVCHVRESYCALETLLPLSEPITGQRLKWVLLSPAIFPAAMKNQERPDLKEHPGGWLPNWVCPTTGNILLKKGNTERAPGESRETWRQRIRQDLPAFECRLVAARIPPPIQIAGWSEQKHLQLADPAARPGPKPTYLAVPAGAVYYFEGPDAPQLAEALAWHGAAWHNLDTIHNRRSALLGEKGFGLGVCGPWEYYEA